MKMIFCGLILSFLALVLFIYCMVFSTTYEKIGRPQVTSKIPPILLYYGSDGQYDYYKVYSIKYKVLQETFAQDKDKYTSFLDWHKDHLYRLQKQYQYQFKGWDSKYSQRLYYSLCEGFSPNSDPDHFITDPMPLNETGVKLVPEQ